MSETSTATPTVALNTGSGAPRKVVGFGNTPRKPRKKKQSIDDLDLDIRRKLSHGFRGYVPGDVAIALESALKTLGWDYWEDVYLENVPYGGTIEIPFQRHRVTLPGTKEVVSVPWGQYGIKAFGTVLVQNDRHVGSAKITCALESDVAEDKWRQLCDCIDSILAEQKSVFIGHAMKLSSPSDLIVPNYMDLSKKCEFICNDDT